MSGPRAAGRRLWSLPIAVAVSLLMLSPGGALLGDHAPAPSEGPRAGVVPAGPSVPPSDLSLAELAKLDELGAKLPSLQSSFPALPSGVGASSTSSVLADAATAGAGLPSIVGAAGSGLPASALLGRVAGSVASGAIPGSAAYLPNLAILDRTIASPRAAVGSGYLGSPAPMGLADYGVNESGVYSVYTPEVVGNVTLGAYNASAGPFYQDTAALPWARENASTDITPWQSALQLNTVLTNVSYPGSDAGVFWIQNVVDFSGTTLRLVDNIWNFSAVNASVGAGTILSGNGTPVPGEFYYDLGPTFSVTSFPVSISLSNRAELVDGRTTVLFDYVITIGSTTYQGTYDTVEFNSTASSGPLLTPDYLVNGTSLAPSGALYDAELVFGGPGDGTNSVVTSLNGTLELSYVDGTSWEAAPAAYDYGADTGETSIGVASVWDTGATFAPYENVSQGPSVLYGLWNATNPVPSGGIHVNAYSTVNYAFFFIGPAGTPEWNLSYAPTAANGTMSTVVPPTVPPATSYEITGFADGYYQSNGSFDSNISAPYYFGRAVGLWNAPIYMNGLAQGEALANTTGVYTGTSYDFSKLTVDVNITFDHVNDYGFPEFDLLWAYGVAEPIEVSRVTQGPDSIFGTLYLGDTLSNPIFNAPGYGDGIAIWSGAHDVISNLSLWGYAAHGGLEVGGEAWLWNSPYSVAENVTSSNGSDGIFAVQSDRLYEIGVTGIDAVGTAILNSDEATAVFANSTAGGIAAVVEGGEGVTLAAVNATDAFGVVGVNTSHLDLVGLDATDGATGALLYNISGLHAVDINASRSSRGLELLGEASEAVQITTVLAVSDSEGAIVTNTTGLVLDDVQASGSDSFGAVVVNCTNTNVADVNAVDESLGLLYAFANGTVGSQIAAVTATDDSTGVIAVFSYAPLELADVTATGGSLGAEALASENLTVRGAFADFTGGFEPLAVELFEVANATLAGIEADGPFALGAEVLYSFDVSLSDSTALDNSTLGWIEGSEALSIATVTVLGNSTAIYANDVDDLNATSLIAVSGSTALSLVDCSYVGANGTLAVDGSRGVDAVDSNALWTNDSAASGHSTAVTTDGSSDVFANETGAEDDSVGVLFNNTSEASAVGGAVVDSSVGVEINGSSDISAADFSADAGSGAVIVGNASFAITVRNASALDSFGVAVFNASFVNISGTSLSQGYVGVYLYGARETGVDNTTVDDGMFGVLVGNNSSDVSVNGTVANDTAAGVLATNSTDVAIAGTTAENGTMGIYASNITDLSTVGTVAGNASIAVGVLNATTGTVRDTTVSGGALGGVVVLYDTAGLSIEGVTVSDRGTVGVNLNRDRSVDVSGATASNGTTGVLVGNSSWVNVTGTTATNLSIGVLVFNSTYVWVRTTAASDLSIGVGLVDASYDHVVGVTATDPSPLANPWAYESVFDAPLAAVVTGFANWTTVAGVTSTNLPIGIFDEISMGLAVQGANVTGADYGVLLNGTDEGILSGIVAEHDTVGVAMTGGPFGGDAEANVVTESSFVDDSSFGVELLNATFNTVYDNDFVGDNGATSTYNATTIQAFSALGSNAFNSSGEIGNYWADWHSYNAQGLLNPYLVLGGGAWDYHPLGAPEGTVLVTFEESGLASGTSWSVTLNGSTESSEGPSIVFTELPGTYSFTVAAVAGYAVAPASGSIVVGSTALTQAVTFEARNSLTFEEVGLSTSANWSVIFNGAEETGSGTSHVFSAVNGTYSYAVVAPAGYTVSPATGSVTVAGTTFVSLLFTSTVAATYSVTVEESGLPSGTSWSATFNGEASSALAPASITFTVPAGTYSYEIGAVAGYASSVSSSTEVVVGPSTVEVTFTSTASAVYPVTIEESGLPSGTTWSGYFDGVEATGTSPAALSFSVAAGTYSYQISPVPGYNASVTTGSAPVSGAYAISVTFSRIVYAVTVSESGLAPGTSWSVTINGTTHASVGSAITVDLPSGGPYAWTAANVSGYRVSSPSTGSVSVSGGPVGLSVAYTSTAPTTSYVPASTYNTGVEAALGIAAIGVVLGLVALFRRPRAPAPATQWKGPEGATGGASSPPAGPGGA